MKFQPPVAVLTAGILMITSATAALTGVRLMDGEDPCSGTPEVLFEGKWRSVQSDAFNYRSAMVVCRELDCGNAVSIALRSDVRNPDESETRHVISCEGTESAVSQCPHGGALTNSTPYTFINCSDSARLVDGNGRCSGRVEVKLNQSWTAVCEADFDWQDAEVVCRELGCGPPLTFQGSLFGEEFQCKGTEKSLHSCRTSTREEHHTCKRGSAVGLTCSDTVRLVDESSRCVGAVEMFHNGTWRRLVAVGWHKKQAAQVCRRLDCGAMVAIVFKRPESDDLKEHIMVMCDEPAVELRKCPVILMPADLVEAGVICSDILEKPTISFSTPIRVSRGLEGSEVFRGHSFTITCSTQPQYPGGSFHLKLPWTNRSLFQTAVNHSASFLFPAADDSHQGNYSCVYENQLRFNNSHGFFSWESTLHNFSSEGEKFSLTITDSPLPAVITRMLLVPLLLLISCSVIFLIFKKWGHTLRRSPSGQQGAAAAVQYGNIEVVSQQQDVERRSGGEQESG